MYYQNNFNTNIGSQIGSSGVITQPHTANGNVYNTLPPPPLQQLTGGHKTYFPTPSLPHPTYININNCGSQSHEQITYNLLQCTTLPSITNWTSKKYCTSEKNATSPFLDVNVTSIKKDFIKCSTLMKEFERLLNLLQVFKRTLTPEDWCIRCEEIKSKQKDLSNLLNKYENPEYFVAVQRVVKRCFKKRIYRKRKKREWQEMKEIRRCYREREHRRIDLWLEKMREQVETIRKQEQVKGEADIVLSEVTTKKSEAKRYINLFNILTKLRNARIQQLTSSGSNVADAGTKYFTEVIDKLKNLWIVQLNEYNLEEQGLRVMLNDAEVERVNVEAKVTRQIHNKWSELLFGENVIKSIAEPNNLDELITNRYEWDRFITTDKCLSSKIPMGWVLPSEPSNVDWLKCIKN